LNHATCDVYSPKAVETCWKMVPLMGVKYIFSVLSKC